MPLEPISPGDREFRDLLHQARSALYATPAQAADILGRSLSILAKWRKAGVGPRWRRDENGWSILYRRQDLLRWQPGDGKRRNRFTRLDQYGDIDLLTEREAAWILDVSQSTMVKWRKEGKLKPQTVPSRFNLGRMMYLYPLMYVLELEKRVKPQCGLGRGKGSECRLEAEELAT
jgi:hypothetical protein